MCVEGCPYTRSVESLASERMASMTDTQIVTSVLAAQVCDLFISQSMNAFLRTTQSKTDFVNAVRQGCISDVTLTGDSRVRIVFYTLMINSFSRICLVGRRRY